MTAVALIAVIALAYAEAAPRTRAAPALQQTATVPAAVTPTTPAATPTQPPATATVPPATATLAPATPSPLPLTPTAALATATPRARTVAPVATPATDGGDADGDDDNVWIWIGVAVAAVVGAAAALVYFIARNRRSSVVSAWVAQATDVYGAAAALRDQIGVQLATEPGTGAAVDLSQAERNAADVNAQLHRLEVAPPDDAKQRAVNSTLTALDALRTAMSLHTSGGVSLDVVRQRVTDYAAALATLRAELGGA
jgi:hypothetical protein